MARTRILYARYEIAKDALGTPTMVGMAIYSSQKEFLGYVPYSHWRKEKERSIDVSRFHGKAMVKLLPICKSQRLK